MDKVGEDGVITVEDSQTVGTTLEMVEGLQFDKGYISPYMVTDPERMEVSLDDAYILIHDGKISNIKDLLPTLEKVVQTGKPLLIIAEDVEGEALATLVVNKLRGVMQVAAVKAPGFGDRRKAMLQDIAIVTGGQVVSEEIGIKLDSTELSMLGKAKKVRITKEETTIVEGAGNSEEIRKRAAQIKKEIEDSSSEYDKEKPTLLPEDDGSWLVQGHLGLEDLSDFLGSSFESEDAESLGGLVLSISGDFPSPGETVHYRSHSDGKVWEIEVLEVEDHRIKLLRLRPKEKGFFFPEGGE